MNISTASLSRQGERASNRDQTGETIGERSACFVVCDGIAGLPGGDVAAALARNAILSRFDGEKHLNAQYIREYVNQANHAIRAEQKAVQDYHRMGTTLVSLFIDRDYHGVLGARGRQPPVSLSPWLALSRDDRSQSGAADERRRASDRRREQQPALFRARHGR